MTDHPSECFTMVFCPECGPLDFTDEDGCCKMCGRDAIGEALDKLGVEMKTMRAELTAVELALDMGSEYQPLDLAGKAARVMEALNAAMVMRTATVTALREYTKDRLETSAYNSACAALGEFDDAVAAIDIEKKGQP